MADKLISSLLAKGVLTEEQAHLLRQDDDPLAAPVAPEVSMAMPATTPSLRREVVGDTEEVVASAPPRKVQIPFSWRAERELDAIERWEVTEGWPAFICRRPDETPEETEKAEAEAAAFDGSNLENTFEAFWYDVVEGAVANVERKKQQRRETKKAELQMLVKRYHRKNKEPEAVEPEPADGVEDPDYHPDSDDGSSEGPPPEKYGDEWAMETTPLETEEGTERITRRVDPDAVGLKRLIEDAERDLQSQGVKIFVSGSQRYVPGASEKIWAEIKGPLEEQGVFLNETKGKKLVLNHKP